MRILLTIPHFHRTSNDNYGSARSPRAHRAACLSTMIESFRQRFSGRDHANGSTATVCNTVFGHSIDIVVVTNGTDMAVDPAILGVEHAPCPDAEPMYLGYECHRILGERHGAYDIYAFVEDDLAILDTLFFLKIAWFAQKVGSDAVVLPSRYETLAGSGVGRYYVDGQLTIEDAALRWQNMDDTRAIRMDMLGREFRFARSSNPHSGCFFLTAGQLAHWMAQPYWLDRSDGFIGPLESAATLGLMRTFRVYKPINDNAAFLEIHHLDNRYLKFAEASD